MRYSDPQQPGPQQAVEETTEERLRRQVADLQRQIRERAPAALQDQGTAKIWRPSPITLWALFLGVAVLLVVAFFAGFLPLQKRQTLIVSEAAEQGQALPRVEVIQVGRATNQSDLELPGGIQAVTEAPILARADG